MKQRAFTLIELLIVVAIIAILAAIAVPNFLEAQTRSKVSRVKADMRSLATAIEAYAVDGNAYPLGDQYNLVSHVHELTTPVAYMTSVSFIDPFQPVAFFENPPDARKSILKETASGNREKSLTYCNFSGVAGRGITWGDYELASSTTDRPFRGYMLGSNGPDRKEGYLAHSYAKPNTYTDAVLANGIYDPTNGTVSQGDIARVGGEPTIRSKMLNK